MSSDKLKPCWHCGGKAKKARGGPGVWCTNPDCKYHRMYVHHDVWQSFPRPSAELGEIARELRALAGEANYAGELRVAERLGDIASTLESLAAPETLDYVWVHADYQDPVYAHRPTDPHVGQYRRAPVLRKAGTAPETQPPSEPCSLECENGPCAVSGGQCKEVTRLRGVVADMEESGHWVFDAAPKTQQPHHPELLREIGACLSVQGRPPSREQLERWRDMLGGEAVQPGECEHHETPLDYWRSTAEKLKRELEDAQADLRKRQPGESVAEVVRELKELLGHLGYYPRDDSSWGARFRGILDRLSRASVGPAEVYVQCYITHGPGDVPGAMFDLQHGSESIPVAVCVHAGPDRPGGMAIPQKFRRKRATVHGVEAKQDGGPAGTACLDSDNPPAWCDLARKLKDADAELMAYMNLWEQRGNKIAELETQLAEGPSATQKGLCDGCSDLDAINKANDCLRADLKLSEHNKAESERIALEEATKWERERKEFKAQLAEIEEINAEYRTTIAQQQVDVAKAEAKLRQSADDCDECEHAERYEAAEARVAALEGDRRNIKEGLKHARDQRDELRRKLAIATRLLAISRKVNQIETQDEPRPESTEQDDCPDHCDDDCDDCPHGITEPTVRKAPYPGSPYEQSKRRPNDGPPDQCHECKKCDPDACPLDEAEQDDSGELPVCPDCGRLPENDFGELVHFCDGGIVWKGGNRGNWLRHVELRKALQTACLVCGELPTQGATEETYGKLACTEPKCESYSDGFYLWLTPAEWLKRNEARNGSDDMDSTEDDRTPADREERQRQVGSASKRNEVKDESDSVRDVHDRLRGICSTDVAASEVASSLEQAREAMDHQFVNGGHHVAMLAVAIDAILEHLEGTEDSKRHYLRHIGERLDALKARLDALEAFLIVVDKRVCRYDSSALCGADESEGK